MFIVSCINYSISYEIEKLDFYEWDSLGEMLLGLESVIKNIDGTMVKIR